MIVRHLGRRVAGIYDKFYPEGKENSEPHHMMAYLMVFSERVFVTTFLTAPYFLDYPYRCLPDKYKIIAEKAMEKEKLVADACAEVEELPETETLFGMAYRSAGETEWKIHNGLYQDRETLVSSLAHHDVDWKTAKIIKLVLPRKYKGVE